MIHFGHSKLPKEFIAIFRRSETAVLAVDCWCLLSLSQETVRAWVTLVLSELPPRTLIRATAHFNQSRNLVRTMGVSFLRWEREGGNRVLALQS